MSQTAAAQNWTMVYWLWAMAVQMDRTTGWLRTGENSKLPLITEVMGSCHANTLGVSVVGV